MLAEGTLLAYSDDDSVVAPGGNARDPGVLRARGTAS
jgi:hypothetical protein